MRWVILSIGLIICASTGCGGPQTPPMRMGTLPYPSPFYTTADPEDLGGHRYGGLSFNEAGRGLIYSERGGFIDLAHIRIIADWTWFYYQRLHDAIENETQQVTLPMNKGSRLDVMFHYPDDWGQLACDEQAELTHKLALRISKELAWILGAWHEIATWFGYSRFVIGSEAASAFTHDDTFSHLVALRAVGRAINDDERSYNEAMTIAIEHEMEYWQAVSPEQTQAAVEEVRGRWWERGGVKRRYLVLSLNGEPQRPWLIPDEPGEPGRLGESYMVPRLDAIDEGRYCGFYTVQIRPFILEASQIRRAAGIESGPVKPFEHFPDIMEAIRKELIERYGPDADQP
ncbi:DUF4056 domain-containing protein [Phycisphaerales bacterium AB-hyl4]|uniref:DUF4056 domain-containing protein n=1 Tax=Natronomicrosphaera hydrolytica TaxID=3242702 RepID=A0ABV4U2J1_9BACT